MHKLPENLGVTFSLYLVTFGKVGDVQIHRYIFERNAEWSKKVGGVTRKLKNLEFFRVFQMSENTLGEKSEW